MLKPTYQYRERDDLFFAGQMTGVEGYVESAASGLMAGMNAARLVLGEELVVLPQETAIGSMAHYITHTSAKNFQPMNANFGLFKELKRESKTNKNEMKRLLKEHWKLFRILQQNNRVRLHTA